MKTILMMTALLVGLNTFAAEAEAVDLSFTTQVKIMNALIESDEAKNNYVGEASYADVMERDLRFQMAGKLKEGNQVTLECTRKEEGQTTLKCSLNSYDMDDSGESAMVIEGDVYFPELSSDIEVSNIRLFIAG